MRNKLPKNIGLWIHKAQDDERVVELILKEDDAPYSVACFLSQQVAEKSLKALMLYFKLDIIKTHDLLKLESELLSYVKEIKEIEEEINIVTTYYIETRYPADFPEGFSKQEAVEAFEAAVKIKNFVLDILEV